MANQAAEALIRANLSARELRITLAVMRITYGWRKKKGLFTQRDLETLTEIRRNHCSEAMRSLVLKKVVLVIEPARGPLKATYQFNKDFDSWDLGLCPPRGSHISDSHGGATSATHGGATSATHGGASKPWNNGVVEPEIDCLKTRVRQGNNSGVLDKLLNEVLRLVRTAGWTLVPPAPWLMEVRTRLRLALQAKSPDRIIECAKDGIERTNERATGAKLAYFLPVFDGLLAEQEPQAPNYIAPDPEFEYPSSWQQRDEVA